MEFTFDLVSLLGIFAALIVLWWYVFSVDKRFQKFVSGGGTFVREQSDNANRYTSLQKQIKALCRYLNVDLVNEPVIPASTNSIWKVRSLCDKCNHQIGSVQPLETVQVGYSGQSWSSGQVWSYSTYPVLYETRPTCTCKCHVPAQGSLYPVKKKSKKRKSAK